VNPRDDDILLRDIREAITTIDGYVADVENPDARLSRMAIDAIKYNLIVIGEAVGNLDDDVKRKAPAIPWQSIKGLRNLLAHSYFNVEQRRILEIVQGRDIGQLATAVAALLDTK
jgi:uncharacterized protein with HEPN domain